MSDSTEEHLAIVAHWSSYGATGMLLGHAYPLMNLVTKETVQQPKDDFPNPGFIFLLNRGSLASWDYVSVRPQENAKYTDSKPREAYYLCPRTPDAFSESPSHHRVAAIVDLDVSEIALDKRRFDLPSISATPIFFARDGRRLIFGPFELVSNNPGRFGSLDSISWKPRRADSIVFQFTEPELLAKGVKIERYSHPNPDYDIVIRNPHTFIIGDVSSLESAVPFDLVPERDLIEWFFRHPAVPAKELQTSMELFRQFAGRVSDGSSQFTKRRLANVEKLLNQVEKFELERNLMVNHFFEGDTGKRKLEEAIRSEVSKRSSLIESEVKKQKGSFAAELEKLQQEKAAVAARLEQEHAAIQNSIEELKRNKESLEQSVQIVEEHLTSSLDQMRASVTSNFPVLAAILPRVAAKENDAGTRSTDKTTEFAEKVQPANPSLPLASDISSELDVIQQLETGLQRMGLSFSRNFLANIYVNLKCFSLNLLAGPPGYGKSTLIRALASVLGHKDAFLEIPVRRSWNDDRALLGFFDSFHGRYDAGQSGLPLHMVQAEQDWQVDGEGLYIVLLDEFNLSAPEYYFSQLMQLLPREDATKVLRLYDSRVHNDSRSRVSINDNLRFWGTINYDETTERLSPRLLDRTGLVYLSPEDSVTSSGRTAELPGDVAGIPWRRVLTKFLRKVEDCSAEAWERLQEVIDVLAEPNESMGPSIVVSPRCRRAIKLYLSNASSVLAPQLAADFAVEQRILPLLRGSGEEFRKRISSLQGVLRKAGLSRSATRVEVAISRANVTFGDIDLLGY